MGVKCNSLGCDMAAGGRYKMPAEVEGICFAALRRDIVGDVFGTYAERFCCRINLVGTLLRIILNEKYSQEGNKIIKVIDFKFSRYQLVYSLTMDKSSFKYVLTGSIDIRSSFLLDAVFKTAVTS